MKRFLSLLVIAALARAEHPYFKIAIVDEATGRGVPLMELRTVNEQVFVTDNAGLIAFNEPGLMGREIFFHVAGSGYSRAKDGFGNAGVRLTPRAGESATVKVKREIIAERVRRLTGQGLYRDSELLGLPTPLPNLNPAGVMGQDSVQAVVYHGKLFWLWGDTNIPEYPLGNFRTTCATSPLDADPEKGIAFDYFMDPNEPKRLRKMMPLEGGGPVWLFGLLVLTDESGKEVLLAHYGHHRDLATVVEHGIARFNDERGVFESAVKLDLPENWRHPRGNSVRVKNADGDFFYFTFPYCHTRVPATLRDVMNPASYEALRFDESGKKWRWQKDAAPTSQDDEAKLIKDGKMPTEQARFSLTDTESGKPVKLHASAVVWNEYRKKFVMIGLEKYGKESFIGEVWYAESDSPSGPWRKAVKVASHPKYSFYNPVQHPFFSRDGGRFIYFEGTYTTTFSWNPSPTPRYEYNQLMYRLDLADMRLDAAR